ncbi:hypothetical protein GCM10027188_16030 [Lysobacter humi (ex Lee et al. 2017)]
MSIAKSFGRQAPSTAASSATPTSLSAAVSDRPALHIIVFKEAPLASYDGEIAGLEEAPRIQSGADAGKLDVKSDEAVDYVQFLKQQQIRHEADLGRLASGPVRVHARMQHALNAIIAEVTPADAKRMRNDPSVLMVDEYREVELHTDAGPALIGAEKMWLGSTRPYAPGVRGEGMVIGIIDTGINWGSPSFAAVSPVDGYTHTNPLGFGNYLGTCAPGQVDAGRCNSKLIGGYDFVCNVETAPGQTYCNQPSAYREEPGFGDTNSHGSHTAATVAGNVRDVVFKNVPLRISGVAPRANIVAFDVCYTTVPGGQGSCPNVSSVQAVNQAIADGVVDALNFSIGGGASPWTDAVSMAFLNAVDAGIYVAASAGNSGPGPNTMSHNEPWVSTTAASQHGRGDFQYTLNVTGPTPVPANLQQIFLTEGAGGAVHSAAIPGNTPLRVSPGINSANDGCAAFPANAFQNAIAVVRRGTCGFSDKVNNASAAGAIAVVIANNQAGAISPSVPGTTVPAFSISQAEGNALATFFTANPTTTTAGISYPPVVVPNTPDQLAAFSSRGPAGTFSLIKPDITAPGVNILAVVAGTTLTGSENAIGLLSGTSMASPHNAGAALLVRQMRPTWTPMEVKSALMMTSKAAVLMQDGVTLANPFSRGTGRVQVDLAARAGLVLNETKANFLAANPATNGDPSTLNLASMMSRTCYNTCTFTRTFRSTASQTQTWNASITGFSSATVSPATFSVAPGQTVTVTVTVKGSASGIAPNGNTSFGELSLVPNSGPTLRLPVAIAIQPPSFAATPVPATVSVPVNGRGSAAFAIRNVGGASLNFSYRSSGTATAIVMNQPWTGLGSGWYSTTFTDPATVGGIPGQYASDDFVLNASTQMQSLVVQGFMPAGALTSATDITWSIYPDAAGAPNGNPSHPTNTAVWRYTAAPTAAGVTISGGNISLNLAAAGQNVTLPAGRYWVVVSPRLPVATRWAWYATGVGDNVYATLTPAADGTGAWTMQTSPQGMAATITGAVTCGAPWFIGPSLSRGQVDQGNQVATSISVNAAGMAPGTYSAFACFATNDPTRPVAPVLIRMTVAP